MSFNINSQNDCMSSTGTDISNFDITFQSTWNAAEHSSIPTNAHWSNLVGVVHAYPNQFLEFGQNASAGIKNVAELGDNTAFLNEIQVAVAAETANLISIDPFNPNNATSAITFEANACDTAYYLTLVSMIAPSPDWFIAVNSLDLSGLIFNNDNSITIDVFAYDAGTDNGTDYNSSNSPNTPVGISLINGYPFNGNKIGTLAIDFQYELIGVPDFTALDSISIFPNPAKDNITISKNKAITLKTIEVYNLLGALVKTVDAENNLNDISLDLSALNKGLYLLKLSDENGNTKTKKLALE